MSTLVVVDELNTSDTLTQEQKIVTLVVTRSEEQRKGELSEPMLTSEGATGTREVWVKEKRKVIGWTYLAEEEVVK